MSLIKVISLTSHFYFQWSSSQEEHARVIQPGLLNPTSNIKKAMAEAKYQQSISIQIQFPKIYYLNFNELLLNFITQYILWYIYGLLWYNHQV